MALLDEIFETLEWLMTAAIFVGLAGWIAYEAGLFDPDPLDTSACRRSSRVAAWFECSDDEVMCRMDVLEPFGCATRVSR